LQRIAVEESRRGIPLLFGFDVIHGLRTIAPVPLGMAASWDPQLYERVQAMAAREARAVGIHWAFAPMLDIARDPRWAGSSRGRRRPLPWRPDGRGAGALTMLRAPPKHHQGGQHQAASMSSMSGWSVHHCAAQSIDASHDGGRTVLCVSRIYVIRKRKIARLLSRATERSCFYCGFPILTSAIVGYDRSATLWHI
jgi:hypothetical protein